jgi:phage terminase Nu1 subunit (DNA packaging protein)
MIIQIRIVIDIPEHEQEKFPQVIESTVDFVVQQFPEYKIALPRSPVIVTIDRFEKLENG